MRKDVYRKMERFPREAQVAILRAIELLQEFPSGRLDIKKMKGGGNIFRLRMANTVCYYTHRGQDTCV